MSYQEPPVGAHVDDLLEQLPVGEALQVRVLDVLGRRVKVVGQRHRDGQAHGVEALQSTTEQREREIQRVSGRSKREKGGAWSTGEGGCDAVRPCQSLVHVRSGPSLVDVLVVRLCWITCPHLSGEEVEDAACAGLVEALGLAAGGLQAEPVPALEGKGVAVHLGEARGEAGREVRGL